MSDSQLTFVLNNWQNKLNITQYSISCERISPAQVCDDYLKRGREFVGICTNTENKSACLFHTRTLHTADGIHELLHGTYPHWSEKQINIETDRLLQKNRLKGGEIT